MVQFYIDGQVYTLFALGMTKRQKEVAALAIAGHSNKEIANQLFVTESCVKFHLTNVFKELMVKNRHQLTAKYPSKDALLAQGGATL